MTKQLPLFRPPGAYCRDCGVPLAKTEEAEGRCWWCVEGVPLGDRP